MLKTKTYLYKAVNNMGNELLGFTTKAEANQFVEKYAAKNRTWCVGSYVADKIDNQY